MEIRKGIGVSPGVVISTAIVLDAEDLVIPKRKIESDQIASETQRLGNAMAECVVALTRLRDQLAQEHGKDIGNIINVHLMILNDRSLLQQFLSEIQKSLFTAE